MRGLDIAIAGCGPCGLASALLLWRAGHQVTLFERFDAPRPIGSGLMIQPTGAAVLAELGLLDPVIAAGSRIERLYGMAGGRVVLDVRYTALPGKRFGIGIHRATLFAILHDAVAAAGIPIRTGHMVTGSSPIGDKRALDFEHGDRSAPFDLVVDALGARSTLAPPTGRQLAYGALWGSLDWPSDGGFDSHRLEQRYRRASVMAGVLPIGTPPGEEAPGAAFFWSLRADRLAAWREAGLARWKDEVLTLWPGCAPLLSQIHDAGQMTFAHYAHRTLPAPVAPAMIHLGDAWHSASPQLGQGANMALLDAWALAHGLDDSDSVSEGIARAVRLRRRHVLTYQWLTDLLTPIYQSDGRLLPLARDWLVGPVSRWWPATRMQAALVSGLVADPLASLGLDRPAPVRTPAGADQ